MNIYRNRWIRHSLFILGWISLVVGFIGIFVPLLPTTPFLILTAWCFLKSSPKAHAWLYRQKYVGQALRDWESRGAIRPRAKASAVSMICVSALVMWWMVRFFWLKVGVTAFLIVVSAFILTRPSR